MPLAAHSLAPRRMSLYIEQSPKPPTCRSRAFTGIVLGETPIKIDRPSDIGLVGVLARTAKNIDKAFHLAVILEGLRNFAPAAREASVAVSSRYSGNSRWKFRWYS